MKAEYDFSKGERGKFYASDAEFSFPVYLEPDVDDFMSQLADEQEVGLQELVNEWLRVNIRLIQSGTGNRLGKTGVEGSCKLDAAQQAHGVL